MYYLHNVDHNGMAAPHLKWLWRVLGSAAYPALWMRLMMMCCGMAVKGVGILEVSVRKMKALTVTMETVTLIG